MSAYSTTAVLREDSRLALDGLPFKAGDEVEITILSQPPQRAPGDPYPLRGTVLRYDDPFEPIAVEDWEALQ